MAPRLPIIRLVQKINNANGAVRDAQEINAGVGRRKLPNSTEHTAYMLVRRAVARNRIPDGIEAQRARHGRLERQREPRRLRDGLRAAPPPAQLA